MPQVLLFGEPMALFTAVEEGPLAQAERFTRSLAGAEVNVAIGLRRLGHSVAYATRVGDDPLGEYIAGALEREGIGTQLLSRDPVWRTGLQLKGRTSRGDPQTAYYRKGSAFSHLTAEDIDRLPLEGVRLVHVTGIPPALSPECRGASLRLMERAREQGIFVSLDPNLRPALWESREAMRETIHRMARLADLFLPGEEEAKELSGCGTLEEMADFYHRLGPGAVIIKTGREGAYFSAKGQSGRVPGFAVDRVVDTVGAGDGFAVGVLSAWLEGLPLPQAVCRGNAIGAMQVSVQGDNEGLPTRTELEDFLTRSR